MRIRGYMPGDLERILKIHEQSGLQYRFPDVDDWRMNPKIVVEDDAGKLVMAAGLRMTSEAYLWLDREAGTANERWKMLLALHETVRRKAEKLGYEDVHAFLPAEMPRGFKRRLGRLGWVREEFEPWWRPTAALN